MVGLTREQRAAREAARATQEQQMETNEQPKAKDWEGPRFDKLRTLDNQPVNGKKWKIKIFTDGNDKAGHVDLAVNGYNIRIRRGDEVVVDEAYVEVLRNAVITSFEYDPQTNERRPTERMLYPFQATPVAA